MKRTLTIGIMTFALAMLAGCGNDCNSQGAYSTNPSCSNYNPMYNQQQYQQPYQQPYQQYPTQYPTQQYPTQYPQQYPQQGGGVYPGGGAYPGGGMYPTSYPGTSNPYAYPCDPRNPYCYPVLR